MGDPHFPGIAPFYAKIERMGWIFGNKCVIVKSYMNVRIQMDILKTLF